MFYPQEWDGQESWSHRPAGQVACIPPWPGDGGSSPGGQASPIQHRCRPDGVSIDERVGITDQRQRRSQLPGCHSSSLGTCSETPGGPVIFYFFFLAIKGMEPDLDPDKRGPFPGPSQRLLAVTLCIGQGAYRGKKTWGWKRTKSEKKTQGLGGSETTLYGTVR